MFLIQECGIRRYGGILFRLIPDSISSTERESYTTPQRGGMGGGMGGWFGELLDFQVNKHIIIAGLLIL